MASAGYGHEDRGLHRPLDGIGSKGVHVPPSEGFHRYSSVSRGYHEIDQIVAETGSGPDQAHPAVYLKGSRGKVDPPDRQAVIDNLVIVDEAKGP